VGCCTFYSYILKYKNMKDSLSMSAGAEVGAEKTTEPRNTVIGRVSGKLVKPLLLAVLAGLGGCRCEADMNVGVGVGVRGNDSNVIRGGGDRIESRGRLAVDPSFRPALGGDSCEVSRIVIAKNDGVEADLDCPNGNFHVEMACPGFNVRNGQVNCPNGGMEMTLMKDGRVIATK
jgi:hypothetical protein